MKKILVIIMVLALSMTLLSGCFKIPKNVQDAIASAVVEASDDANNGDSGENEDNNSDNDSGEGDDTDSDAETSELVPATNPSTSYSNFMTVKSNAVDRITEASANSDALSMTVSMNLLGVSMIDLSLIVLTMFSDDLASSEMAMGFLGLEDVKITGSNNDYTITYKDTDGATIKQTCQYDVGKDTLSSTLYDGDGKLSVYIEYVNLGDNTYAAQYYYPTDEGGFEVLLSYFDQDNVAAFGIVKSAGEPASILGQSNFNEEFVKNDNIYMILVDGKLTVSDNGTLASN